MASFFRWRIADKVIPFFTSKGDAKKSITPNIISTLVKVLQEKGKETKLFLPWINIENLFFQPENLISPARLVTLLKNQGLPTAEGFLDIELIQNPMRIMFTIDPHVFSKIVLCDICANDDIIAKHSCIFQNVKRSNIVVHCSSPSIGDLYSMTHFRSAIHGRFVANINKEVGHHVTRTTDLADWGLKSAILLTSYKQSSDENKLLKNPSQYLHNVLKAGQFHYSNDMDFYNRVKYCFEQLNKGDEEVHLEWKYLRKLCADQHLITNDKIGAIYDDVVSDSEHSSEIARISKLLLDENLVREESEGRLQIKASSTGAEDIVLDDSSSSSITNFSRSIFFLSSIHSRHNFDTLYFLSPKSERANFSILSSLMNDLGYQWSDKIQHIKLQDISDFNNKLKNFEVEEILSQAKDKMMKKLETKLNMTKDKNVEKMAEILSYSSLCIHDMKHWRKLDYGFRWEDILSFDRGAGTALQLCHAGLKGVQKDTEFEYNIDIDASPLLESDAQNLIRHLSRFDEIVLKAYLSMEPAVIVQYLFLLWYLADKSANVLKLDIRSDRLTVIKARLLLLSATLKVLRKGLKILGIEPYDNTQI